MTFKKKTNLAFALAQKTLFACVAATALLAAGNGARADWRTEMGVFRIGVAAVDGEPYKPGHFEPFREAVSKALAMPVEIFQARDAAALIDAQASSRIEYSIFSALAYATADALCSCVEPLAAPTNAQGATAVRSLLIVDTKAVPDMQALATARIGIGPESSLTFGMIPRSGFLFDGKPLAESGLKLVETGTQEEALKALTDGELDAVFAWDYALTGSDKDFTSPVDLWLAAHPEKSVATLWRSEAFRFGPHVVRRNLPAEAVSKLRELLLSLNQQAPLAYDAVSGDLAGGFVAVQPSDYAAAADLVKRVIGQPKAQ